MSFHILDLRCDFCNGGSKYENVISFLNHIVRPIKWKGITSGLIFCYQNISQDTLKKFAALKQSMLINQAFPSVVMLNWVVLTFFFKAAHNSSIISLQFLWFYFISLFRAMWEPLTYYFLKTDFKFSFPMGKRTIWVYVGWKVFFLPPLVRFMRNFEESL